MPVDTCPGCGREYYANVQPMCESCTYRKNKEDNAELRQALAREKEQHQESIKWLLDRITPEARAEIDHAIAIRDRFPHLFQN